MLSRQRIEPRGVRDRIGPHTQKDQKAQRDQDDSKNFAAKSKGRGRRLRFDDFSPSPREGTHTRNPSTGGEVNQIKPLVKNMCINDFKS